MVGFQAAWWWLLCLDWWRNKNIRFHGRMLVVWGWGQFSKVRPLLDLETHLLLYQQEDGKGETCGERSEVCGQDLSRDCWLDGEDDWQGGPWPSANLSLLNTSHFSASNIQSGLFLPEGQVDVDVRPRDGRPGVQQGPHWPGDDRYHKLQAGFKVKIKNEKREESHQAVLACSLQYLGLFWSFRRQ